MRRHPTLIGRLALVAVALAAVALTFRQGWLPARFSPLPRLDLASPLPFVVDWQLAELAHEVELCRAVLQPPLIDATAVADKPYDDGCGWSNAVRLSSVAGARLPLDKLTCPMAAALALWMVHDVQPLALELFGERVQSVQHMGGYACRNILGSQLLKGIRSQHARANAIDVSAFTLTSGRRIPIKGRYDDPGKDGEFLRRIHDRSCRYFRVSLGPEYNAAHHDHFHFDRGLFSRCR